LSCLSFVLETAGRPWAFFLMGFGELFSLMDISRRTAVLLTGICEFSLLRDSISVGEFCALYLFSRNEKSKRFALNKRLFFGLTFQFFGFPKKIAHILPVHNFRYTHSVTHIPFEQLKRRTVISSPPSFWFLPTIAALEYQILNPFTGIDRVVDLQKFLLEFYSNYKMKKGDPYAAFLGAVDEK
jgi:hypothetical protein